MLKFTKNLLNCNIFTFSLSQPYNMAQLYYEPEPGSLEWEAQQQQQQQKQQQKNIQINHINISDNVYNTNTINNAISIKYNNNHYYQQPKQSKQQQHQQQHQQQQQIFKYQAQSQHEQHPQAHQPPQNARLLSISSNLCGPPFILYILYIYSPH